MKLLDDLNKRKKIKKMLEEIEGKVDNIESIDDVKALFKELIKELRELL